MRKAEIISDEGEKPKRAVINRKVLERLDLYSSLGADGWQEMRHPDPELRRQAEEIETHHGEDSADDNPPHHARTRRKIRRTPQQS